MRHTETPPNWAIRLKERSRQRRTGNRITRWIALPTGLSGDGEARTAEAASAHDPSSNDNLFVFPARRVIG